MWFEMPHFLPVPVLPAFQTEVLLTAVVSLAFSTLILCRSVLLLF